MKPDNDIQIKTKNPRGKLIVIEGVDGSGKTYVINQIIEAHPDKFVKFPFPTFTGKEKLKQVLKQVNVTNLESVLDYHFLFLEDILNHQTILNEKLTKLNGKHIILDRYYFSTICYLKNNIRKLFPNDDTEFTVKWQNLKEELLYKYIDQCIAPDHVILLINNFKEKNDMNLMYHSHADLTQINTYFHEEIINYHTHLNMKYGRKSFDWTEVESFSNTLEMIQGYMTGHKILNIQSGQ